LLVDVQYFVVVRHRVENESRAQALAVGSLWQPAKGALETNTEEPLFSSLQSV
jgi:hypothetical protein